MEGTDSTYHFNSGHSSTTPKYYLKGRKRKRGRKREQEEQEGGEKEIFHLLVYPTNVHNATIAVTGLGQSYKSGV